MTLIALIYDFVTIQGTIWVYNLIAGFDCRIFLPHLCLCAILLMVCLEHTLLDLMGFRICGLFRDEGGGGSNPDWGGGENKCPSFP